MFYDKTAGEAKTPHLERIVLYDTAIKAFGPDTFRGLTELKMLSFVNNKGFGDTAFDNVYWDDLVSLEFFDFFSNNFVRVKAEWFGPWAKNILRLAFWNNAIEEIDAGVFDYMDSLEFAYFHCTALTTLPAGMAEQLLNKPNFVHLTINDDTCTSEPCPWQTCNQPPYPENPVPAAAPGDDEPVVEAAATETVDCDKWGNQGKCEARSGGACMWVDGEGCVPTPWEGGR